MIESLADQIHIKVCLSSRPLLAFEEAFSGKPSLRLQDLTFDCIRQYTEAQLSKPVQERLSFDKDDRYLAGNLLDRIVERADRVFPWDIIAIRDVREGLRGFANMHELAQAIETLPSELESLFVRMLNHIKPVFKRDAACFIGIVLYQEHDVDDAILDDNGNDLCRLYFSQSQRGLEDAPFTYDKVPTEELTTACHLLRK